MKYFILIIVVMLYMPAGLFSDTKTDEAHEKMEGAEYVESSNDTGDLNKDDDEKGIADFLGRILFSLWFNVDLFSETPGISLQPVRYNPFPYYKNRTTGLRNTVSNRKSLLCVNTAFGRGLSENTLNSITNIKYNFYGFSTNIRYRFLSEEGADKDIQYYSIKLERKSFALPRTDAGIMLGWNELVIGDDHYDGFGLGYNFELYPLNPVSVKLLVDNMFYKNKSVFELQGEMRFHRKNLYIGVGYNYLDIDRTVFRTMLINMGLIF